MDISENGRSMKSKMETKACSDEILDDLEKLMQKQVLRKLWSPVLTDTKLNSCC
jgi:hypothetical protein